MSSIDERVVNMQFNNKQFESGASETIKTLDSLKKKLNTLDGSNKAFDDIGKSAKNLNLDQLSENVGTIANRFSTMGVVATTALANIANSAINTGKQLLSSFTLTPILDGFHEYELQIGSIQTILANTKTKGTTLDQVNAALDELNTYADKTIYNFAEMTHNIGTFTAAGVDLDRSVSSIKGIANLAALSGSSAAQASSAMYQLSQAIAAGKVQLMDWNSVVNAGMGGEQFQNALKRTAEHFGTNVDAMIEKYGSFRESLTQGGWLTTDVLVETLKQLSGAYSEADLIAQGYTEDQAKAIVQLAKDAEDSATKIRTFTQLISTVTESLGSGWASTWQILFGDFEETTELWSSIGDAVTGAITQMSNARNELLQGWKDLGGRTDVIDGLKAAFEGLASIVGRVSKAFRDVFPKTTAKQLKDISSGFKDLMEKLKPSEETLDRIGRIAEGVFSAFDLLKQGISALLAPIGALLGSSGFKGLLDILLEVAASVGDFFTALDKGVKDNNVLGGLGDTLSLVASKVGSAIGTMTSSIKGFGNVFSSIGEKIAQVAGKIKDAIGTAFSWIADHVSLGDVFTGFSVASLVSIAKSVGEVAFKIKDALSSIFGKDDDSEGGLGSLSKKFGDILDSVHDSLETFQNGIKVGSLVAIAAAIGILASALQKISKIKSTSLAKSLGGIAILFKELTVAFASMSKTLSKFDTKGIIKSSVAMIAVAEAMNILADAIKKLSDLSLKDLGKGLIGVGGGIGELVIAMKLLDKVKVSLKTSVAILAIAEACKKLSESISAFSGMSWDEIKKGLTGMGGALGELTVVLATLSKVGGGGALLGGAGLLVAVQSLDEISENLEKIGKLSWNKIKKGLAGMGGALGELGIVVSAMGKIAGFSGILGSGSIVIAVQALNPISDALKSIGSLSWDEIKKGLVGMGGALGELAGFSGILGVVAGISGILGSGSILIAAQALQPIANALKSIGELSWDEIQLGLGGMRGALSEISGFSGVLGVIAGFSGILGAGSILIAVQALQPIATALQSIGSLSWDAIQVGLVGMGGALGELGIVTGALGNLAGLSGLIGAGTILVAVQGLQPIASALQQISTLSWEEIKIGLAGMGGALVELGAVSGATGALTGIAGLVGAGTITLASQGLDQLATAFQKFATMDWESVKSGLVAMGAALGETALGSLLNTLSGFGAGAIAEVAGPLGQLADSVKKWQGVSVPENLGAQMGQLADGVGKFTFSGFGAGPLAQVAKPLGDLASSVKKWSGVSVPDNLQSQLSSLAQGVQSFSFAALGGFSIGAVSGPLSQLADSVKNWSGVSIPEGIGTKLSELSSGINSFALSFAAGFSIDSIVGPLSSLADSIKKWNGIAVPENFANMLSTLSNGVGTFVNNLSGKDLAGIATGSANLASAVSRWNGIFIPDTLGPSLVTLGSSIQTFSSQISQVDATGISALATNVSSSAVNLSSAFQAIATSISSGSSKVISGVNTLRSNLASMAPIFRQPGTDVANSFVNAAYQVLTSSTGKFRTAASKMASSMKEGFKSQESPLKSTCKSIAESCANSMSKSSDFRNAGSDCIAGFTSGIKSGRSGAITAAANVAKDALAAAKRELDIHSPSRKFKYVGEMSDQGLANGFKNRAKVVIDQAKTLAYNTASAVQEGLSVINSAMDSRSSFDISPTVSPVIDMDQFNRGSRVLGSKMNATMDISSSISDSFKMVKDMQDRQAESNQLLSNQILTQQKGIQDSNKELLSAISGLQDSIDNDDGPEIGLYVDGNRLASSIAKPMNRQLNILSKRGGLS